MKTKLYLLLVLLSLIGVTPTRADIANYAYNSSIILYPNPAINTAHIILPDVALEKVQVYIINLQGSIIQSLVFAPGGDQLDIDVSNLPAGDYSIRILQQGFEPEHVRLIKQ